MASESTGLAEALHESGVVRFGTFTLKDGRVSPFYLDFRILVSRPRLLARVGQALAEYARNLSFDRIAALPYAGLPIGVAMCLAAERPMIYARKEAKDYGTRKLIEGEFVDGERALIVDDVITSGGAKVEGIVPLREAGLRVEDVLVIVERGRRGRAVLERNGLRLHALLTAHQMFHDLAAGGRIEARSLEAALEFLERDD